MKKTFLVVVLFSVLSGSAFAGTVTACSCKYEGISGDYALYLATYSFENKLLHNRKVGTYFNEQQCQQTAVNAQACNRVTGGSQYCSCSYDVISGDYLLTRYIQNESGKMVLNQKLATYFGQSQCSNAALFLAACQ